jgi:multiple sugar transport system substrate-binding protein
MQTVPGGLFDASLRAVMYQGKAYSVPHYVSPTPLITRLDILDAAKVDPPKTWDEFIEVCKKLQKLPKLTGYGMCLGLHTDSDNNIMNKIWSYGGKLVEADDKTVVLNSPGTVQAVKVIADMYRKHKIIPKGAGAGGRPIRACTAATSGSGPRSNIGGRCSTGGVSLASRAP